MQPHHQQQQVITTGVVQPGQPYVVQRTPGPFNDRQATVVGIFLIIIGCLSILFNTIDLAVGTGLPQYDDNDERPDSYDLDRTLSHASMGTAGHGFWCGALIIVAGVFGIAAGRDKSPCKVNAFMVLTIIGAVFAAFQFVIAAAGAGTMHFEGLLDYLEERDYCDTDSSDAGLLYCRELKTVFAMEILLAILGVAAFISCLWGSILCCIHKGCCTSNPVVAFAMMPAQPQVTVVSQQQQQQPVAYQQPAGYPAQPAGYAYQ